MNYDKLCCGDPGDCSQCAAEATLSSTPDAETLAQTHLAIPYFDSVGNEGTLDKVLSCP